MSVRLKVARHDALSYVLYEGGAEIGWLRGGRVGFGRFADRAQARRAGEVAASVLADWYATRWHSAPVRYDGPSASDDQIVARGVVIGRVLVPGTGHHAGASAYGFELALPRETWLAVMLELAQRIHTAVTGEHPGTAAATLTGGAIA